MAQMGQMIHSGFSVRASVTWMYAANWGKVTLSQKAMHWTNIITYIFITNLPKSVDLLSGVARAFPGGRTAHPEDQNEEEN